MNIINSKNVVRSLTTGISILTLAIQAQAASYCTDKPTSGKIYKVINAGADLLIAAEDDAKKANVEIQANTGAESQRFFLNKQSDGYWALQATNTEFAVTIEGGSQLTGATAQQKPFGNSTSQEWEISQKTSGSYKGAFEIINRRSGLTLTAAGAAEGSDVFQDKSNNDEYQFWWLEPVDISCSGSDTGKEDPADTVESPADTLKLSGKVGDGEITLSWPDPKSDSNFQVYQDTDSDPSGRVRIAKLDPSTFSYTATGLENGTTYYFWVKYTNSDGASTTTTMYSGTPVAGKSNNPDSGSGSDSKTDTSSSAAAPTAAAASKAGANREPLTNGFPSFIKNKVSSATVVSSASKLLDAIDGAKAGDVIYIRAGTYKFDETIKITQSGTSSKAIVLSAYPGDDRPILDFSAMSEKSSNQGIDHRGDYWHFYGFDIRKAGDNGMYIKGGSYNTVEFMKFYENSDTGLQISEGAAYNFIKNSDSYYNADSSLENADGFAAKLGVGTGNYFYGCRAWQNLDDGFDGYLRDNGKEIWTTWEYSWMVRNGYQKNGSVGVGDGNGFKTGGSDGKDLEHNGIYINTIAAENTEDGYDQNSNRGDITIYNAISYGNNRNYGLSDGSSRILKKLTIKNSISVDTNSSDKFGASSTSISKNTWNGISASSSDFVSMDTDELLAERQEDGSLPIVKFFHLKDGSDLIDAGTNVGLDYNGSAPDLGAFESK